MAHPILELENLEVSFSKNGNRFPAVKGLSLSIGKAETYGLVGESGSGKSISSLAIMQLLPKQAHFSADKLSLDGQSMLSLSRQEWRSIRGKSISMIFQEPMSCLNPLVPAARQIMEALQLHLKLSKKDAELESLRLLEKVGLQNSKEYLKKYPHELSGGQQQRVMIAMAVSCRPKLLIADEPTTALDVTVQKQVLELLANLKEELKMSLLFITHDLAVIADIADKIGVMRAGELVEQASTKDIFEHSRHPYTRGLISCRPPLKTKPYRLLCVSDFVENKDVSIKLKAAQIKLQPSGAKLLEIKNLSKTYRQASLIPGLTRSKHLAVDDVSLDVYEGYNFGIVGESGSGKTSLARLMMKLIEPDQGEILFRGENIAPYSEKKLRHLRSKIQYIFQNPYAALNPRFTIEETLLEPMIIHQIESNHLQRNKRIDQLLDKVGLSQKDKRKYPHEFSGGQRQRICIARALSVDPELVICDESVAALDVSIQAQILNLLLDLQEEQPITYVFISHDLAVVRFFCDYLAVMKDGKIVEHASTEQVFSKPQTTFTQHLLDSVPRGLENFSYSL